jgi:hypothetical protein
MDCKHLGYGFSGSVLVSDIYNPPIFDDNHVEQLRPKN